MDDRVFLFVDSGVLYFRKEMLELNNKELSLLRKILTDSTLERFFVSSIGGVSGGLFVFLIFYLFLPTKKNDI